MSSKKHQFWIELESWALPVGIGWRSDGQFFIAILCFHYSYQK